jgi:hypothetical protein
MTEKPDFPDKPDFPIEYHTEIPLLSVELQEEIETRLIKLAEGRSDMTGAAVAVTQPAQRDNPYIYQARILETGRSTRQSGRSRRSSRITPQMAH